jgi:hypothetical protein
MYNDQRIAEIEARCELATPGPWEWRYNSRNDYGVEAESLKGVITLEDIYLGYPECGEHLIMDIGTPDADFIAQSREDIPYLLSQLAERDKEIERLREAITSVHESLDFADTQRQSCKNYTELAINNGLALGQIAVALKHDFKEPEEGAEK